MNKLKLIDKAAEVSNVSKKDTEKVVEAVFELISGVLASGGKFHYTNFGTLETRIRSARDGINPQLASDYKKKGLSKEKVKELAKVEIPVMRVLAFNGANKLKDAVKYI